MIAMFSSRHVFALAHVDSFSSHLHHPSHSQSSLLMLIYVSVVSIKPTPLLFVACIL